MKCETFQVGGGGMPELCFSDNDYDRIPDCRYVAMFSFELFLTFFLQNSFEIHPFKTSLGSCKCNSTNFSQNDHMKRK